MNRLFRSKTILEKSKARYCWILPAGMPMLAETLDPKLRYMQVPNVLNVYQHIGNVPTSMLIGAAASYFARVSYESVQKPIEPEANLHTRLKSIGLAAAVAAGLIGNGLVETKYGLRLIHATDETTPDSIDLGYGVVAAAIGSFVPATKIVEVPSGI